MDVRGIKCSIAPYSNSMSVPIILHTLLVTGPSGKLCVFESRHIEGRKDGQINRFTDGSTDEIA